MSPERDKTHRHGLTRQAACKGQPRARQCSRKPGRKAGQHMHFRYRALPGWHLSLQSTWPSNSRSQAWPEGHWRISKCLRHLLLPAAGWCIHTRRLQPSRGMKLKACRWLQSRSHRSPAPALPPHARALPSTSKQGAPRLCCGCPASSPASAPSASLPTPGTGRGADRRQPGPGHPLGRPHLPPIPCGARGQSCSSKGEFSSPPNTPQSPRSLVGPRSKVPFAISTQRFPSPEMRLRCRCSARSDTYLLRLPQVVLGSAREETAGQVVEWAQPLLGHWHPGDAASTREEPRLASIALWLTGEG